MTHDKLAVQQAEQATNGTVKLEDFRDNNSVIADGGQSHLVDVGFASGNQQLVSNELTNRDARETFIRFCNYMQGEDPTFALNTRSEQVAAFNEVRREGANVEIPESVLEKLYVPSLDVGSMKNDSVGAGAAAVRTEALTLTSEVSTEPIALTTASSRVAQLKSIDEYGDNAQTVYSVAGQIGQKITERDPLTLGSSITRGEARELFTTFVSRNPEIALLGRSEQIAAFNTGRTEMMGVETAIPTEVLQDLRVAVDKKHLGAPSSFIQGEFGSAITESNVVQELDAFLTTVMQEDPASSGLDTKSKFELYNMHRLEHDQAPLSPLVMANAAA